MWDKLTAPGSLNPCPRPKLETTPRIGSGRIESCLCSRFRPETTFSYWTGKSGQRADSRLDISPPFPTTHSPGRPGSNRHSISTQTTDPPTRPLGQSTRYVVRDPTTAIDLAYSYTHVCYRLHPWSWPCAHCMYSPELAALPEATPRDAGWPSVNGITSMPSTYRDILESGAPYIIYSDSRLVLYSSWDHVLHCCPSTFYISRLGSISYILYCILCWALLFFGSRIL